MLNLKLQTSNLKLFYLCSRNLVQPATDQLIKIVTLWRDFKFQATMALHNRVSRQELKDRIKQDPTPRTTISFYCYFGIEEPDVFRNTLYKDLSPIGVLGRIYVAQEGINAQ